MENNVYYIWKNNEYSYKAAYGFVPNIRTYIHDDDQIRDAMLVVPGGGYCMCTPHESELIAKEFYNKGMNAFVLTYTTDITMSVPLKDQPLNDIARAVRFIRSKADEFKAGKLTVCGFSAGGHVCATLLTHYDSVTDPDAELNKISARPDAGILCYPVITAGEYTHIWSIQALLGKDPSQKDLDWYSAEKNVTENTPPCFIWQTVNDSAVPVKNSYLMAEALKEKGVPFAHYVFPEGDHGLSLPVADFFSGKAGGDYVFEQVNRAIENVRNNTAVDVSEERRRELIEQFSHEMDFSVPEDQALVKEAEFKDIRMWPDLAMIFLKRVLS